MSKDHAAKIRQCIDVMSMRTKRAIEAIESGKFDRFVEIARLQNIAFHNFKAIDANAKDLGYDIKSDPEICDLILSFNRSQRELIRRIATAKQDTSEQLRRIENGRKQIARFKSRIRDGKNLVQTV